MNNNRRGSSISSRISVVVAVLLPVLLIAAWEFAAIHGYANVIILSMPSRIAAAFVDMVRSSLLSRSIIASLDRIIKGFLLGAGLGLVLGGILALNKNLRTVFGVFIGILRPIPPVAMIPIFILLLGIGEASKIGVVALGTFWPVLLSTLDGMRNADPKLLELAATLEKSKIQVLFQIILPSAIPPIFTGLRLGMGRAWSVIVAAEMIAASAGVGFLIEFARTLSRPAMMMVGVGVIGIIGLLIDWAMYALQKKLVYWQNVE